MRKFGERTFLTILGDVQGSLTALFECRGIGDCLANIWQYGSFLGDEGKQSFFQLWQALRQSKRGMAIIQEVLFGNDQTFMRMETFYKALSPSDQQFCASVVAKICRDNPEKVTDEFRKHKYFLCSL